MTIALSKPNAASIPSIAGEGRIAETREVHTRLACLALGIEESRAYWEQVDSSIPPASRVLVAFEQRWFGSKSLRRVRYLIGSFIKRYDAFPGAIAVLHRWRGMDPSTRHLLCHWHTQLTDPLYRRFTDEVLLHRRAMPNPLVNRDAVLRWVRATYSDRWSEATCVQFASKLVAAASEAGLLSAKRDPRALVLPKVPDEALAYLLHLLRGVQFDGSLTDNPFLRSVGLEGGLLDHRLRTLPHISFRRMANLIEFDWEFPDLLSWGEATL